MDMQNTILTAKELQFDKLQKTFKINIISSCED